MPADSQIPQPTSRTRGELPRPAPWFPWRSILIVSGLMLGVYAVVETPHEIGCWHMAAANEFWIEGEIAAIHGDAVRAAANREQAFARMATAMEWHPDDVNWLYTRAMWNSQVGKHEAALADCERVIGQLGERDRLLAFRMEIYQKLGRHAEAVKDANQLDALSQTSGNPPRGDALNTVAYAKAVGKIDLPKALQQADESVRRALEEIEQNKRDDKAHATALAVGEYLGVDQRKRDYAAEWGLYLKQDTRGFVNYQLGNYKAALADLDAATDGITRLMREQEAQGKLLSRALPDARPSN